VVNIKELRISKRLFAIGLHYNNMDRPNDDSYFLTAVGCFGQLLLSASKNPKSEKFVEKSESSAVLHHYLIIMFFYRN